MMNLKSSKEEVSNPSELKVVEAEVVMESPEVLKVKSRPVKKVDVRKMAIIGVLAAISIMLSMTPLGFIPIGPTNATIMHIPVIIGAIVEGPLVGITVGFIFGMVQRIDPYVMKDTKKPLLKKTIISVLCLAVCYAVSKLGLMVIVATAYRYLGIVNWFIIILPLWFIGFKKIKARDNKLDKEA